MSALEAEEAGEERLAAGDREEERELGSET